MAETQGRRAQDIGQDEAWAVNLKTLYDELLGNVTAETKHRQAFIAALDNLAVQAMQNAVETANMVSKNAVEGCNLVNKTIADVAIKQTPPEEG